MTTVMAGAVGALTMAEIRARAAQALAPALPEDPYVFDNIVDAVEPPALILTWGDPWLLPKTIGGCLWDAQFVVLCIAGRVEPDPGIAKLEELVTYTINRLQADDYPWPVVSSQAPRRFDIAGLTYLGARVTFRVPVTTQEGA